MAANKVTDLELFNTSGEIVKIPTSGSKRMQDNVKYNCPSKLELPKRNESRKVSHFPKEVPENEEETVGLVPTSCLELNGTTSLEGIKQTGRGGRPKGVKGKKTSPGKRKHRNEEDNRKNRIK